MSKILDFVVKRNEVENVSNSLLAGTRKLVGLDFRYDKFLSFRAVDGISIIELLNQLSCIKAWAARLLGFCSVFRPVKAFDVAAIIGSLFSLHPSVRKLKITKNRGCGDRVMEMMLANAKRSKLSHG